MDKNFNEFFDELNDMANFKGFGEKPETEEIIIDGVNVEDCSYYNKDNYPYCCEVWDNECEAQNCYYKQLQRLQQENAELKEKNTALEETLQTIEQLKDEDSLRIAQLVTENARLKNERTADLVKQIDELKAENERLEEKISKFRWDNPYFDLYNNVVNQRDMWEQKSKQYKSCLQEIKKYSTEMREIANDDIAYHYFGTVLSIITKAEEE